MNKTDFLFARPSFFRGIGKNLNLGSTGKVYNSSKSARDADMRALASDWKVTGADMRGALDGYEKEYKEELKSCSHKR